MSILTRISRVAIGSIALLINATQPAHPDQIDVHVVELITWIARNSDLQLAAPPEIQTTTASNLSLILPGYEIGQVEAAYDTENRTLLLSEGWDVGDLRDQSILIHELVHHLQIVNETGRPCNAALNRLAYTLQLKWLEESGIEDAMELIGMNDAMIFQQSSCGDPFGNALWP